MTQARRYLMVGLLALLALGGLWLFAHRSAPAPVLPAHSYSDALQSARQGSPGAARTLYQQLARDDLDDAQRVELFAELPNYPSPQALKLASKALLKGPLPVREAALQSIVGLVPDARRSILLGPLLDDPDPAMRYATAHALLSLSPDDLGLYFGKQQQVLDDYALYLGKLAPSADIDVQLADIYLSSGEQNKAATVLDQALQLAPDNFEAVVRRVELLEKQHQPDAARSLLGQQLDHHPQTANLQHALGQWLLRNGQNEYALLGLARAVELEPANTAYRYDLALALHGLDQIEAAQKQLEDILQRQPANRQARVLLIQYWKETGQPQNIQVLMAELEQQNPDDPELQQGL